MSGVKVVPVEPTAEMVEAATEAFHLSSSIISIVRAALAVAPVVQGEPVASPTAGMNLGQRIRHVGGCETERGIVQFGSVMAVKALVDQVLRDIATAPQPTEPQSCPVCKGCGLNPLTEVPVACANCHGVQDAEHHPTPTFQLGDHVRKTKGSQWKGRVVGTYSTSLTPEGYAVESDTEKGSVQIYPVGALELVGDRP